MAEMRKLRSESRRPPTNVTSTTRADNHLSNPNTKQLHYTSSRRGTTDTYISRTRTPQGRNDNKHFYSQRFTTFRINLGIQKYHGEKGKKYEPSNTPHF
eukprot:UN02652